MPITTIRGRQVLDGTIQRTDLDTSTAGQAVVAKIIQGANVTLSSTGGDSGTGDVTISAATNTGPAGVNAFTITAVSSFTVPAVGATTTVNVANASWIVVGQLLYFDTAGGGAGLAGALQVTAKTGNLLTLLNPQPPTTARAATLSPGTILDYGGSSPPVGCLECDGASYAAAAYPALFAALGYSWGGAEGNFNVPDLRDRRLSPTVMKIIPT